jgi:hypothetical protein
MLSLLIVVIMLFFWSNTPSTSVAIIAIFIFLFAASISANIVSEDIIVCCVVMSHQIMLDFFILDRSLLGYLILSCQMMVSIC